MSFRFEYSAGPHKYSCPLKKTVCAFKAFDMSKPCNERIVIGGPFCPYHMAKVYKLKVQVSTIKEAGNGVFAWDLEAVNGIVFRKGDFIIEYTGEILGPQELYTRYGPNTAPYAMATDDDQVFIDSACLRSSMGALINGAYGNARSRENTSFVVHGTRVFIKADCDIRHGEELFIDYGDEYGDGEHVMKHTTKATSKKVVRSGKANIH